MTQPPTSDARTTPLYDTHVASGATMVEFAGWLMPLRYRSESAEHRAVRDAAGLFDLSHMGEIRVHGPQAADCLDYALVGQLSTPGRAHTMIVTEQGGVLDDHRLPVGGRRLPRVANAANWRGGRRADRAGRRLHRDHHRRNRGLRSPRAQGPQSAAIRDR